MSREPFSLIDIHPLPITDLTSESYYLHRTAPPVVNTAYNMHRALSIEEIVRKILQCVDGPRPALALALSGRCLCSLGLEAVWLHGSTWDLAMSIPEYYRSVEERERGDLIMVSRSWLEFNYDMADYGDL